METHHWSECREKALVEYPTLNRMPVSSPPRLPDPCRRENREDVRAGRRNGVL